MQTANDFKYGVVVALVAALMGCDGLSGGQQADAQTDGAGKQDQQNHQAEAESGKGHETHGGQSEDKHEKSAGGGGQPAEHEEDKRRVHLTGDQRKRLNIKIGDAGQGSATAVVEAPATVVFDADRVARVGPRLEAKVVKVTKDLGEKVQPGDTVAVLDSVALGRAKAAYLTARARFSAAYSQYQRDQKLADQQITSEAELLESRATYQQARAERDAARAELRLYGLDDGDIETVAVGGDQPLSRYPLTAPIAGTIQRRDLVVGETVSAQQTPIHIVNTDRMWVMIEAFEKALPRLEPGQKVELSVRALPGRTFTGKTDWVSSELDEQARTVRVRAAVPNPDGKLRAGMFGTARIQASSEARYALVPIDAVQTIEGEDVVFIPGEEVNAFEAVTVTTGSEGDGQVEIRKGLMPGDAVVAVGAFDLSSALTAGSRSAAHSH